MKLSKYLLLLIIFHPELKAEKLQVPTYPVEILHTFTNEQMEKTDISQTLPDAYLDQVIQRKKDKIQNCAEKQGTLSKDFLVELTIFPNGRTQSRLINSDSQDKEVLKCALSILNRIQFKKFNGPPIVKGYHFQFT
ncbi:MAG: hypothetical protein OXK80_00455 [Bdellovibrionales bacterium]|nr:hypothetical protein [Bdellovibrionales bacterium]